MVNIQEAGVFACQVLNRDLWSDKSVKEIVKENFVFLQVNTVQLRILRNLAVRYSYLITKSSISSFSFSCDKVLLG